MAPFFSEKPPGTHGTGGVDGKHVESREAYIDTITEVSDELSYMADLAPLVKLLTMVYKVRSPNPGQGCHLDTLMRTLSGETLDTTRTKDHPKGFSRDEATQSFSRFLSPVLNGLTGLSEIEQAVGAGEDPAGFRQFWSLDNRNLLTDAISGSGAASASDCDIDFLDTFVAAKDRRIALTRNRGFLALVPSSAKPDDEIRGLPQSSQVHVLRKGTQGDGTGSGLLAIGEAYLHGYAEEKLLGSNSNGSNAVGLEEIGLA